MKISPYLSQKLKVLSFIAIIFVVFIHSTILNIESYRTFYHTQAFLRTFWNAFFPLFFSISGYLFFKGFNGTKTEFIYKFKSRFKTLVIPYIFWNIAFLALILFMKYNPLTSNFINSDFRELFSYNVWGWLNYVFVMPVAFHLWFVRDLILIVFFSPVIWYLCFKMWYLFIAGLITAHIYGLPVVGSIIPFAIGAVLALHKINIEKSIPNYLLSVIFIITIISGIFQTSFIESKKLLFITNWLPFLLIWFGNDYLYRKGIQFNFLKNFIAYTFFIYVFHEPTLNIFKKVILMFGKGEEWSVWLSYFISPLLLVFLAVFVAKLLLKINSDFYKIITGGRVN